MVNRWTHSAFQLRAFFACIRWQFRLQPKPQLMSRPHRMCFKIFVRIWIIGVFVWSIGSVYLYFCADFFSLLFFQCLFVLAHANVYVHKAHTMTDIDGPMLNSFHWQNKYLYKWQNKCSEKWMLADFFFVVCGKFGCRFSDFVVVIRWPE